MAVRGALRGVKAGMEGTPVNWRQHAQGQSFKRTSNGMNRDLGLVDRSVDVIINLEKDIACPLINSIRKLKDENDLPGWSACST
jgi:hypothetical protein